MPLALTSTSVSCNQERQPPHPRRCPQRTDPDFIAIDQEGIHWLIEVKMDKEMTSADVAGKRNAARRWANHVSADEQVNTTWRYLLASETDIETARGSWPALKSLAT